MSHAQKAIPMALVWVLATQPASADPFFYPGFGATTIATRATTADRGGAPSLAANPAALADNTLQATASYVWAQPGLYIRRNPNPSLQNRIESESSDASAHLMRQQDEQNARAESNAENVEPIRGIYAGVAVPLAARGATATTSLGIGAYIPQGSLASVVLGGESTPQFVEYQDRNQTALLSAAVAHSFGHGWSVGAGMVLDLVQAQVNADVFMPLQISLLSDVILSDDPLIPSAAVQPRLTVSAAPRVRPIAGVLFAPSPRLAFGLNFRDESSGHVRAEGTLELAGGLADTARVPLSFDINTQFQPRRLSFGGSWMPTPAFRVLADVTWMQWSRYRPALASYSVVNLRNLGRSALAASGITDLGLLGGCVDIAAINMCLPTQDELLARIPDAISVKYTFDGARDIFVPRIGAAWQWAEHWSTMAGYSFRPSFESADGFTLTRVTTYKDINGEDLVERSAIEPNLLDNAQHEMSAGVTVQYAPFSLTISGLYAHMIEKKMPKNTAAAVTDFGYTGYAYGGYVAGGAIQAALTFD